MLALNVQGPDFESGLLKYTFLFSKTSKPYLGPTQSSNRCVPSVLNNLLHRTEFFLRS